VKDTEAVTVHFLGTSGWFDSETGNTICIAVETPSFGVVLDAGNGLAKLDRTCSLDKPWFILLSHLHLDHVAGLHTIGKMPFSERLWIVVPDGQREPLERLMAPPFTTARDRLPFPLQVSTVSEARDHLPFEMEALELRHSVPTVGYRLRFGERVLAYIADTGPCDNALQLAEKAELLLTECAYLPGESSERWPHLNPEAGARIARDAEARQHVLVHFDASRYDTFAKREEAQRVAAKVFPNTRIAYDGMIIDLKI